MRPEIEGATRRDVIVEGVRFALWRAEPPGVATGVPVMLLHGVPETAVMWRGVVPELARDRLALAPDLKGLGESEPRGPYDVPTLVRELAALARNQTDGMIDAVGHDWGGTLAVVLARRHPELVRRLVVVNAPYRYVDYTRAWHMLLFSVPALPEALMRAGGGRAVDLMIKAGWRAARTLEPAVLEHYREAYAAPEQVAAMLGYYRAATRPRVVRAVTRLLRPAGVRRETGREGEPTREPRERGPAERSLVVWGARDPVLPVAVGEAAVRDLGARTEMVTVPGAGHFVVEEAPDVAVPAIADFLRYAPPAPPGER